MYSMKTLYANTKVRQDHTTAANILTSANQNVTVSGPEIWTAPADGVEVKKGDIWMKVTYNGVTGWMAHIHKGQLICNDFKNIVTTPPAVVYEIPEYFDQTDPNGVTTRYYRK